MPLRLFFHGTALVPAYNHTMNDTASLDVEPEIIFEAHDWSRVASVIFNMISFLDIC